jgi:hypothetical protein
LSRSTAFASSIIRAASAALSAGTVVARSSGLVRSAFRIRGLPIRLFSRPPPLAQ